MNRENLEWAAKAAGLEVYFTPLSNGVRIDTGANWNPYKDHGDRYRLARACGMELDFRDHYVFVGSNNTFFDFTPGDDASEAEAIVDAAAEIGRAM